MGGGVLFVFEGGGCSPGSAGLGAHPTITIAATTITPPNRIIALPL
jgi:hypothetical protein